MKKLVLIILVIALSCSSLTPCFAWGEVEDVNKLTVGDLNGDGKNTATDALYILHLSLGCLPWHNPGLFVYGDLNGDLVLNAEDALIVLKKSVKLIDEFPDISGNATIKASRYEKEELALFAEFISGLEPVDNKDRVGNSCHKADFSKLSKGEFLEEYDESALISWFGIGQSKQDDSHSLYLVAEGTGMHGVLVYELKPVDGELILDFYMDTYIKGNMIYLKNELLLFSHETLIVHPLGSNPVESLEKEYLK